MLQHGQTRSADRTGNETVPVGPVKKLKTGVFYKGVFRICQNRCRASFARGLAFSPNSSYGGALSGNYASLHEKFGGSATLRAKFANNASSHKEFGENAHSRTKFADRVYTAYTCKPA